MDPGVGRYAFYSGCMCISYKVIAEGGTVISWHEQVQKMVVINGIGCLVEVVSIALK